MLVIACWRPDLREPDYVFKIERLRRHFAATEGTPRQTVVMFGTSRTAMGLMPGPLEEQLGRALGRPVAVFNFGIPGAGLIAQRINLKRMLDEGIKPDLVLIEILPPLLAGQVPPVEKTRLPPTRLEWSELPLLVRFGFPRAEVRRDWWATWAIPWYRHRFTLLSHYLPAWLPSKIRQDWCRAVDNTGWFSALVRPETPAAYRKVVEIAREQYVDYLTEFRLGGPSCEALRETLEVCRREGIATALVLMPEGSEFRGWYSQDARRQIRSFLGGLCREFDAPLIDAERWIADEDFSDSHHLLHHGATSFTRRLGRATVPLLERQFSRDLGRKAQHAEAR
jgi:hypothetical protein